MDTILNNNNNNHLSIHTFNSHKHTSSNHNTRSNTIFSIMDLRIISNIHMHNHTTRINTNIHINTPLRCITNSSNNRHG